MNAVRTVGVAAACSALLAGCAATHGIAPAARVTDADSLAADRSLADAARAPQSTAPWPESKWWERFSDPQLDALIEAGLAGSPTLRVAQARTRAAIALTGVAAAGRQPAATLQANTSRERYPEKSFIPPPYGGSWQTMSELRVSLSWSLDFWGKQRAAWESALGEARAAQVDEQAARIALAASIAHAYVQFERAWLQWDVAQATLAQRVRILELTRQRNAEGLDSRLELKQAEAALPAAREQVAQVEETLALTRNQIAALLGAGPDRGIELSRPAPAAQLEVSIPARLPSQLLGRRPDIVAQRLRVEAADQRVTGARAEFYPDVNLTAFAGFQAIGTSGLLAAGNRELGVGPALDLPLFDAGRRRGTLAARSAEYDAAVEQYNATLVGALREVADQLASLRSVASQRAAQREGLAAAQEAYDLANLRYREGVGSYLQVLSTESPLLEQRGLDAQLRTRALDLSIDLARALGGGFEPRAQGGAE
jgi:NodT family efflux transporter outer membrane factor (OMF) lipoprotein